MLNCDSQILLYVLWGRKRLNWSSPSPDWNPKQLLYNFKQFWNLLFFSIPSGCFIPQESSILKNHPELCKSLLLRVIEQLANWQINSEKLCPFEKEICLYISFVIRIFSHKKTFCFCFIVHTHLELQNISSLL